MKNSATHWIQALKDGSDEAVQHIVAHYFEPVARLVAQQLSPRVRRAFDEEDVALSALDSFVRRAREGRFENLSNSSDLWRLLVTISLRKAAKSAARETADKRGGGGIVGESAFASLPGGGIDALASGQSDPASALECQEMAAEIFAFLDSLKDPALRDIALWTAQGLTAAEVAEQLNCSPRTVERKLKRLREKAQRWAVSPARSVRP
jgi:RNA polymerase sigma factor (sigma-70 family)